MYMKPDMGHFNHLKVTFNMEYGDLIQIIPLKVVFFKC